MEAPGCRCDERWMCVCKVLVCTCSVECLYRALVCTCRVECLCVECWSVCVLSVGLYSQCWMCVQCAQTWSRAQRTNSWRSRDLCACPPRFCASPPAKPPAVRAPRPGTATRCASTSASLICTALQRLWSRSYPSSCHTNNTVSAMTLIW